MRSQTKVFILLAGVCMLALSANAKQVHFLESSAEESAETTSSKTYVATVYLDTFSDDDEECLLTTKQEGSGEGLIFEDYDIDNLCIIQDSRGILYLVATQEDEEDIEVVKMGKFSYSYRVRYVTSEETLYIQRTDVGEDSTDGFSVAKQSSFEAEYITAYFDAADQYDEIADESGVNSYSLYGYETSWTTLEDDEYEELVTISQEDSRCFTPDDGRLEGIEICVEFSAEGVVDFYADDVFVFRSVDTWNDYSKIKIVYNGFDNFINVQNSKQTETLFYVPAIDILYIANEGDMSYGMSGELSIELENTEVEQLYRCLTFKSSLLEGSALYPSIQAMCLQCEMEYVYTSTYECDINFLLELDGESYTYANITLRGDAGNNHEHVEISYDLEEDQFNFEFIYLDYTKLPSDRTFSFKKYADEVVIWAEDPEYFAPQSLNENYLLANRIEYSYGLLDAFRKIDALQFSRYNEGFGIWCSEYRCMIGFLRELDVFAVKIYEGQYTDWMIYSFLQERGDRTDEDLDEMICLSLANYYENYVINDCYDKDGWMRYQTLIGQYPIYDGSILTTDYFPESDE